MTSNYLFLTYPQTEIKVIILMPMIDDKKTR